MENQYQENKIYDTGEVQKTNKATRSWNWLLFILLAGAFMVLIRVYVVEPYIVSGLSMYPNYKDKDYLVVWKLGERANNPDRGDQIIFKYPKDPKEFFIKRVIGLPGEKIQIIDGKVKIYNQTHPNGYILDEPYLKDGVYTRGSTDIITMDNNEYYVMGDNREASSDSRTWGKLNNSYIIGRVLIRVFPLSSITAPEKVKYNQ